MLFDEKRKLYLYEMPPIDSFLGMTPLPVAMQMAKEESEEDNVFRNQWESSGDAVLRIANLVIDSFHEACFSPECNWEGDIKNICVFAIPHPDQERSELCLIWKQENNGTTFISSPIELDYLNEYRTNK